MEDPVPFAEALDVNVFPTAPATGQSSRIFSMLFWLSLLIEKMTTSPFLREEQVLLQCCWTEV